MRYSAVMSAIFMDGHTVLAVPANELICFQLCASNDLMTFGLVLTDTNVDFHQLNKNNIRDQ